MDSRKLSPRLFRKVLTWTWLTVLVAAATAGCVLVLTGTRTSSVGRYLVPPEMLPGYAVLCAVALAVALTTAKFSELAPQFQRLRNWVFEHIDRPQREKQQNMFLIVTGLIIAFSMTSNTTPMYRLLEMNFAVSAFINLCASVIAALGLFSWVCSLTISIDSKGKP